MFKPILIKVLITLTEQGFGWFSISIHDTVWTLISCPNLHFITCMNVKIHLFNVPLQVFLCQFQFLEFTPLYYEQQNRFNIHRHSRPTALSVLWSKRRFGDRVRLGLITERDRELVPQVCFITWSNNDFRLDVDCHMII